MGKLTTFFRFAVLFISTAGICRLSAMTANPILSRGKTVYTSSGNVTSLTDNKYGGTGWNSGNNSWLAINVGANYSRIFVNWNDPAYAWSDSLARGHSCASGSTCPVNYTIQKSSNSTNGSDGAWTTMVTVTNNRVTARGHVIDNFTGASWVKMNITTGGGSIDEFEVFDMSNNGTDLWFFPGTSISANTYKSTPPAQDFADLITAAHPGFNPAMIRGGIPCIYSQDVSADISKYLNMTRDVKYWAIEMGTNDAWGGGTGNVTTFKNSLQLIIDSCKAAGIQPIIARLLATNPAASAMTPPTWQINPAFEAAIDTLTKQNKLIAGPDLYAWFLAHPGELNTDGVHPNATGAASIQRLWAQAMDSLYRTTAILAPLTRSRGNGNTTITPAVVITNEYTIGLRIVDVSGRLMLTGRGPQKCYIVKYGNDASAMKMVRIK